jgi:hypothetical protein
MTTARRTTLSACAAVIALVAGARPAAADETPAIGATMGGALLGSEAGGGLALDARLRFRNGIQLGLALSEQALGVAYLSGAAAEGLSATDGSVVALFPLVLAAPLELDLRVSTGVRYLHDLGVLETPYRDALRSTTEIAFLAHVRLGARFLLRAGAIVGVDLQVDPGVDLADQSQLLTLGLGCSIGPNLLLYGNVDVGGTYGFDGDNGKAVTRGALGFRVPFGADPRTAF